MNQCLILLLGLLLTVTTLKAQYNDYKIGLDVGLANLDSDVGSADRSGMTAAINVSKSINQNWSLVATYNFSKTKGLDYRPTYEYAGYSGQYQPSFQNHSHSLDLTLNRNIFIQKSRLYFSVRSGIGITAAKTMMDILNANNITYAEEAKGLPYRLAGCPQVICGVTSFDYEYLSYDKTYETLAVSKPGGTTLGNHQLFISVPLQFSMMFVVTQRLDLGLSMNMRITPNDFIDGIGSYTLYNGETRKSNNTDLYKSYRLLALYRLGNNEDKIEY